MMKMNNKRIKILYISPTLASGGAERLTLDLMENIDKEIFSPSLLLFAGRGFFYEEAQRKRIKVKSLKKRCLIDPINFYSIYKYIKRLKPDIVHTQMGADFFGRLAAKLAGVKIIVSTEHNVLTNYSSLISFLKRRTASWSKKTICVSQAILDDMKKQYKNKTDLQLIYNGIDVEKFSQIKRKIANDEEVVFGSLGRLSEQKNYSLLIQAVAQVKSDLKFKFKIAGEGELRERLLDEIRLAQVEDKIELVGVKEDVPAFLQELDFFILPSKWEGLGIVLLEAGLARLPVLASATGGILEIIEDQVSGVLFENDNLADLVAKIEYFLDKNNRANLDLLGENLYNKVINNFAIKDLVKKYEQVYLSLIKKYENTSSK